MSRPPANQPPPGYAHPPANQPPPGYAPPPHNVAYVQGPPPGVCPVCGYNGPPMVHSRLTQDGILAMVIILIVFFPLFWIPLCMPSCYRQVRTCPNCGFGFGYGPIL